MSPIHPQTQEKSRPSVRTLRMDSFASVFERLRARALAAGVAEHDIVLPAEGVIRSRDGLRLHYLEWSGRSDGPLLLLLHGGGLHAHSYDVVGLLARHLGRVVALDLRGHGESEWAGPGGYSTEHHVADIEAVVDAFGQQCVVVAHSLSAFATLVWASRQPPSLAALVIVDVGLQPQGEMTRSVSSLLSDRPAFTDLEEAEHFITGVVPDVREAGTSGVAQNLAWTADGLLSWKHDSTQFTPAGSRLPTPDELRAAARAVRCPAVVLRGARSRVLSDSGAAELAGLLPHGRWRRIPDAGHSIQTSNPRGLVGALTELLDDDVLDPDRDKGIT
jgi:esterase